MLTRRRSTAYLSVFGFLTFAIFASLTIRLSPSGNAQSTNNSLMATLFFDGSNDPRFFQAIFGEPVIDSQGRLLLGTTYTNISCGFGICGRKLTSISPDGTLNWLSDGLSSDPLANNNVLIGPGDRAYILASDSGIFALDATGNMIPGWPVTLPSVFGTSFNPVVISQTDGTVYARTGVTSSFTGFPVAIVALNPDGSEKWRTDYSNENEGGRGLVEGINGNIYTIIKGVGLAVLDKNNGVQLCSAPDANGYYGSFVGGSDGVFSSLQSVVSSYGANCTFGPIFQQQERDTELRAYQAGVIFAIDYPLFPFDPSQIRLVALSKEGNFLWRNSEILPAERPIRAIKNGVLYVIGQHLTDSNKQKLFLLDPSSGEILNSLETAPYCSSCGVAVANDGTIYLNDLSSTRIYRLLGSSPTPTPTPNIPPTAGFTMTYGAQSATEGQTLNITAPIGPVQVNFSANRSSDPDGTVTGWQWVIDGVNASNANSVTYGLSIGSHTIVLSVTDNQGAISGAAVGVVDITLPPPPTIRMAPFDFFDGCNDKREITGGGLFSLASAIVFSDPLRGNVNLNIQAAGVLANAFGQAGVGVNYVSEFSGSVKIQAVVSIGPGYDLVTATILPKIGNAGIASIKSDVFLTATPPLDATKTTYRFRDAIVAPLPSINPIPKPVDSKLHIYNPPEQYAVEQVAQVSKGGQLRICAGVQSKAVTTAFPGVFASSKALYSARILEIRITPQ